MSRDRNDTRTPGRVARGVPSRLATLLLVSGFLLLSPGTGPAQEPDRAGLDFFETHVRPLLVEHCYSCHSADAPRIKGGLTLDTRDGLLLGGDLGPAIEPGNPDDSLLIQAVRYEDDLLRMPPSGKLGAQEIERLAEWVRMGAPDPRAPEGAPDPADASEPPTDQWTAPDDLWSFQPPADLEVPEVEDQSWSRSDLDRFILARLEAEGLSPAPEADRRTLIRRATFDLTGLPPTPEEINAFLADDAPDAFARVVDRLLASPSYGERWGRHWLDIARYADSNGLDENVAHGNAWRYRDYVVNSFNDDTPYDQFILEQIAGDLLPEPEPDAGPPDARHARLIATGFLALGPKVLAEPDQTKMQMDIVDEQLDTLGRTFMGLTIGCARCHDHKFDPITTADYYALAGIFKSTQTMESFKTVARWHENPIPSPDELRRKQAHDALVSSKEDEIRQATEAATARLVAEGDEDFKLPEKPESLYSDDEKAHLKQLRDELAKLKESAPELPSAMGVAEGTVDDIPIHIRGSHLTLGDLAPRRVPEHLDGPEPPTFADDRSGRLELARWIADEEHPLTARVMVNRIWRWHFGEGIVDTPDNFGSLGGRPSHPELLDWLALRFSESGWSIKAMHRLILTSSTYRMAGAHDPTAAAVDPENRLLWRMNVRRLESEAIRDALLAIGGSLDRTLGGSLLTVGNRDYFFNHTSKDTTEYDSDRRSLYLPVVRNHLYDLFQLFDSTDASVPDGDRATTTVAPQALFLMNSGLVLDVAGDLAADLLGRSDLDDPARLRLLYERAYARPPSPGETDRALAYLDRLAVEVPDDEPDSPRLAAWQALCQVILASDEFVYIR